MSVSAIAAMAKNRVIGIKNELPWKISEDMKYFRDVTRAHRVIMGRKTFDSLGRPLPKRENYVVTRQKSLSIPGVHVCESVEAALDLCRQESGQDEEVFIIGGSQIYELSRPYLDRVYLTLINQDFEGDAKLPDLGLETEFSLVSQRDSFQEEPQALSYSFLVYERNR